MLVLSDHKELFSGKHKTTGMNVQVACDLQGRLVWVLDAYNGSRHDSWCLRQSGVLEGGQVQWIGDKAYVGTGCVTPFKKKSKKDELLDWQKQFNTQINKVRATVERTSANLKTWRILHTDYRRPLSTFKQTITTVIALHFWATA